MSSMARAVRGARAVRTARPSRIPRGVLAALAALTLGAAGSVGAASTAVAAAVEAGDGDGRFASCPTRSELPSGADPAQWRCEAVVATGHLRLGSAEVPISEPMTVTHAEGRIDGEFHQVFGGLEAAALRVPGTPLSVTPGYGGSFDFLSDEERMGELDMVFGLSGPGLPRTCSIGSGAEPIGLVLQAVGEPAPGEMPGIEDQRFALPRTSGCGPYGRVLDRLLELPSPSGQNSIHLDGTRFIRAYTELS
ncbi:hypothetical protein ACWGJ2_29045 [Streptomyces sp. NPDC054796]